MKKILCYNLFFILLFSVSCNSTKQPKELSDNYILYIGAFGDTIYKYSVSKDSLVFTELNKVNVKNPSYLTLSDDKNFVYSVSENGENSAVAAIKNDSTFSLINLDSSVGAGPCFIKFYENSLFTANYSSGTMNLFPLENKTGKILPSTFFVNYNEFEPNLKEKITAHAHTTRVLEVKDSNNVNAFLLVTDLGADKIMTYKIESDSTGLKLNENTPSYFPLFKKHGPRHLDILESKSTLYVLGEISGVITAFKYSVENGNLCLKNIQEIAADTTGANGSGDIHISPSGRYLYASNRLINDGIAIFKINEDATLTKIGYQNTGGHPRNFVITPDEKYLFVASRDAQRVEVYEIDNETGLLTDIRKNLKFSTQKPTCLIFE